jgi:hypothetical protein
MTDSKTPASHTKTIKEKLSEEAKMAFILTLYFGIWFCALTFLAMTTLDERPLPISHFGIAFIKAAFCAKFMLIAQAIFPLKITSTNSLIKPLFVESLLYLMVVLALNFIEAGVEGVIHGKDFFISMTAFSQSNPMRVVAMSIVYWLIVWPYLLLSGLNLRLGTPVALDLLFGVKK